MNAIRRCYLGVLVAVLCGCAASPTVQQQGVVIEDRSEVHVEPLPQDRASPESPLSTRDDVLAMARPTPRDAGVSNLAVRSLIETALVQREHGRSAEAIATLERALRVEPRNPLIWHRLAVLRYERAELSQAAQLAAKSNSFAGEEDDLQAKNWKIIAQVREQTGDVPGAMSAHDRAARFERSGE